jgi:hypothetical protein
VTAGSNPILAKQRGEYCHRSSCRWPRSAGEDDAASGRVYSPTGGFPGDRRAYPPAASIPTHRALFWFVATRKSDAHQREKSSQEQIHIIRDLLPLDSESSFALRSHSGHHRLSLRQGIRQFGAVLSIAAPTSRGFPIPIAPRDLRCADHNLQIGCLCLLLPALHLQDVAQMQTRFRRAAIASCGSAVCTLRLTEIAHLLARMTVFHPNRQIIRVAVEDPAVKIGSAPPLSRFKCAIGIVR